MEEFDPLTALGFGILMGVIVQGVASRLRYNGAWDKVPLGRKIAMAGSGGIAAAVAGLYNLANPNPNPNPEVSYVYNLWLWQTVAAWLGALFLDAASQALKLWVERGGKGNGNRKP